MSNVVRFPAPAVRALPDNSLRGDRERLMRRLVQYQSIPKRHLHLLADVLDEIIDRVEPRDKAHDQSGTGEPNG